MAAVSAHLKTVSLRPDFNMAYHVWQPAGPVRAGVLLLHGFGEHSGRYDDVARSLAERGILVIAPDARGHGRSGGRRGHVLKFNEYLDDLDQLQDRLLPELGLVPSWFVLGHSMGGLMALRYILRHGPRYKGLILSNPLLGLAVKIPRIKAVFGRLVSSIVPSLTLGNELNPDDLSRDPEVGRAYVADPQVHRVVTARWFTEMLNAVEQTHQQAVNGLRIPVLFLLSTDDRIADANAARTLFERMSGAKELKIYTGMYHELFNDFDRAQVFADLNEWIDRQLQTSPTSQPVRP